MSTTTLVRHVLVSGMLALTRHGDWKPVIEPAAKPQVMPAHETQTPVVSSARVIKEEAGKPPVVVSSTLPSGSVDDVPIIKPGCTAADESILVHGHLEGLAKGQGGFGLLKESKKRLERAVRGADGMGDHETALKLKAVAELLPEVHDEAKAAEVAAQLEPLLPVTWELGKRCGGTALAPHIQEKVVELAQAVREGKITREQAVAKLREGLKT